MKYEQNMIYENKYILWGHDQVMKILQKSCEQLLNKSWTSCELLTANKIAVAMAETIIPGDCIV